MRRSAVLHTHEIIVNGKRWVVVSDALAYDDFAGLANLASGAVLSITFRNGVDKQEGTLPPGKIVKIQDGMIFDTAFTGAA
jgi:hypothetical protein